MAADGMYEEGSFLHRLGPATVAELRAKGTVRRLRAGSALFVEGEQSDRVLVLLRGRVKVFATSVDGRESVLAIRGAGDLLGELSAVDGLPRSASAAALEDAELLTIDGPTFRDALDRLPEVAHHLLRLVVERLRDADRKRAEFGATDAGRRVARRLVELSGRYGESDEAGLGGALPLTQDDLAAWTGASREAVSRALGGLRRAGLIETGRRSVRVLDLEGLRRRAR